MPHVSLPPPMLRLLGPFRLDGVAGARDVAAPGRRVLAFLALHGCAARSVVAGTLWPESTDEHAHGSLRTALWRLHRDAGPLVVGGETLALREGLAVDARLLAATALAVVEAAEVRGDEPRLDLLFAGDLLPGWDDDWVVFERERLRQLRLHALETFSVCLARRGRYSLALNAALTGVRVEPLRESMHRAVVAVHLAEHNTVEAVRHYRAYRRLVRAELGIEPSGEFTGMLPPGVLHIQ
ncbi:SARP family transcriptional regulator [Actinocorallia sp. API 0066]|uniref:AfsR/SARP family transcriptional regulator n=1 Tax=Actinocorallia sp. API 0066 TaxID=2896846 RepID=UPI001E288C60|nr:BTAD domain-containing putative transcriptional regulator [Actinocorallia sp. API 0066]MCD0449187.1 SARP family transcriptional regulator [Actinocorallia sp. API 0066]